MSHSRPRRRLTPLVGRLDGVPLWWRRRLAQAAEPGGLQLPPFTLRAVLTPI